MPIKKTVLSVFMFVVFGVSAMYEHAHGDKADLITLVMSDLASKPQSEAIQGETVPVVAPTSVTQDNQVMTPQQYAEYLAKINAESAANEKAKPVVQAAPPPPKPVVTRRVRRGDDEEEGDDDESFRRRSTVAPQTQPVDQTQAQLDAAAKQIADLQAQIAARQAAQQQNQAQSQPAPPPPTPAPAPQPAPEPPPAAPEGQYRDGTYTGSSAYAYYGYVQVQATIQGGKLTDVQFLQYPSDRRTSASINSQAMPMLKQEAIQAQSASVNGVSGASDTSQAFVESLSSALSQAHV